MNALVPFQYHGLHTTEAIFATGPFAAVRRFRMTRKGWGEFFGAEYPQKYMDNLKARHPELHNGIPLTVRGMTGQEYVTLTLDCIEAKDYAVWSDLPRARQYLLIFHELLEAAVQNRIKLPDKSIAEIAAIPPHTRGRLAAIKALAAREGVNPVTIWRRAKKVRDGVPPKRPFHPRDRGKFKAFRTLAGQELTGAEIARKLNVCRATIYRWRKK